LITIFLIHESKNGKASMVNAEKIIVLSVFVIYYSFALSRNVKIAYALLGAAGIFLLFGVLKPGDAVFIGAD